MFSPINSAHSISEVVVFLHFRHALGGDEIDALFKTRSDLKEDLPIGEEEFAIEANFQFGPSDNQNIDVKKQRKSGFVLRSVKKDGSPEWAFRLADNTVNINCLAYTRWAETKERVLRYLKWFWGAPPTEERFVELVGLKYVDQFLYQEDESEYAPSDLLNFNSPLISRNIGGVGHLWHCHTGWFAEREEIGRPLVQLNVASAPKVIQDKMELVTTIENNIILRKSENVEILPDRVEGPHGFLTRVLDDFHNLNKELLSELLSEEAKKRIGLEG